MDVNHSPFLEQHPTQHQSAQPPNGSPYEIEILLERFYHTGTSNEEKRAIECKLQELQQTSFNWRFCLANMNKFHSQYLWFFAATTVETTINTHFELLSDLERFQLRQGLFDIFTCYPEDVPALQRDKMAQLMALVARRQCDLYPEYTHHVMLLLAQKFTLGLALTRAIGDSVTQSQHVLSSVQQNQFNVAIRWQMSEVLGTLNGYCAFFVAWMNGDGRERIPGNMAIPRLPQYAAELMQVLQQYFTWIDLNDVAASMVNNIVYLARRWDVMHDASITALGALAELQYRNQRLVDEAARQMILGVYDILHEPQLAAADELYQEKVTELVRLFIDRGWPYAGQPSGSPPPDVNLDQFLARLLAFTVSAKGPHALMDRFAIWAIIFRRHGGVDDEPKQHHSPAHAVDGATRQTVVNYAYEIVNLTLTKICFRSHPELETLDAAELDENSETELSHFYQECYELVQKAIILYPMPLQEQLLETLVTEPTSPQREIDAIVQLISATRRWQPGPCTSLSVVQLRYRLRDFMALNQLVVRLCVYSYGKSDTIDATIHRLTVEHIELFMQLADGPSLAGDVYSRMPPISDELIAATAQVLVAVKTFLQLGPPRFDSNTIARPNVARTVSVVVSDEQKKRILEQLPVFLQPACFSTQRWKPLATAAVDMLYFYAYNSILGQATCIRVFEALNSASIIGSKLRHLDTPTASLVRRVVCYCLLNPDGANGFVDPHTSRNRAPELLRQYIEFIGSEVLRFAPARFAKCELPEQKLIVENFTEELGQLSALLAFYDTYNNHMRHLLAIAMDPILMQVLAIFRSLVLLASQSATDTRGSLIEALFDCCYTSISALQTQLGGYFVENFVGILGDLFRKENAVGIQRLRSLTTLLNTFRELVQQVHYRSLLSHVVRGIFEDVWPMILAGTQQDYEEPEESCRFGEACGVFYQLLHDLLHYQWQFFNGTNASSGVRSRMAESSFYALMNAYVHAIDNCRALAQVIRTVLGSLEMLEERRNLFSLPHFIDTFLSGFMNSLLGMVLGETGPLHQEQVVTLLYSMTRVDLNRMISAVMALGMTDDLQRLRQLECAEDIPTFRTVMDQLINDARLMQRYRPVA